MGARNRAFESSHLEKNKMIYLYFIFTFFIIFIIFYISPQKIFVAFIQKVNNLFFIFDNNIFIKEYIYSCFFIAYLICIPFIIFFITIIVRNLCYKNSHVIYFLYIIRYSHVIAIIINYIQFNIFFSTANLFNIYSEGFELSNAIFNIKGFFWDSIYSLIIFCFFYFICFYFPIKINMIIDSNFIQKVNSTELNKNIWILRISLFIFYSYFFMGLSTISALSNYVIFIFFVEFIFFICRFFFFY